MKMEPLHKIVVAGFAAVVITIIACTVVLDRTLMRMQRSSGNDDVVSAVEKEGARLREFLGEKRPAQKGQGLYWFDQ